MRNPTYLLSTLLFFLISSSSFVSANWISVAPGIEYSSLTIAGPNRIFITRMSRASTNCIIDSMIGQGRLNKT
ncbi:MAG: hypothetical protein QME64_12525 [bacterium]|nr:hypothetical protein [bacterium]